jgi:hypothetical protein
MRNTVLVFSVAQAVDSDALQPHLFAVSKSRHYVEHVSKNEHVNVTVNYEITTSQWDA